MEFLQNLLLVSNKILYNRHTHAMHFNVVRHLAIRVKWLYTAHIRSVNY